MISILDKKSSNYQQNNIPKPNEAKNKGNFIKLENLTTNLKITDNYSLEKNKIYENLDKQLFNLSDPDEIMKAKAQAKKREESLIDKNDLCYTIQNLDKKLSSDRKIIDLLGKILLRTKYDDLKISILNFSIESKNKRWLNYLIPFTQNERGDKYSPSILHSIKSKYSPKIFNYLLKYFDYRELHILNKMVFVKGGSFKMGRNNMSYRKPVHRVSLDNFYIGRYQVTQKEWKEVMGNNPSKFKGDNLPVENVSWYDAIEFCNKLSKRDGLTTYYNIDKTRKDPNNKNSYDNKKWIITLDRGSNGYRLPTEAEWEYAARGGNLSKGYEYSGSNNIYDIAWCYSNTHGTNPIGKKQPNELGIYDMSGNVWEWCFDWYGNYSNSPSENPIGPNSGSDRVNRGGSWKNVNASYCRVAFRGKNCPTSCYDYQGFRLVRSAVQ